MKTECPHCNTVFAITQAQLEIADGMVRCGVCDKVFNAHVQDDLFVADDNEHDAAAGPVSPPATESAVTAEDANPAEVAAPAEDVIDAADAAPAEDLVPAEDAVPAEDSIHAGVAIDAAEALQHAAVDAASDGPQLNDTAVVTEADKPQPADDDAGLFEAGHGFVVPDNIRYAHKRRSLLANLFWGTGSLLLLGALLIQYAWIQRDALIAIETTRPWLDRMCEHIDCSRLDVSDPASFEMTSRNVYTHPNVDEALMISITLVNRASFTQQYPDIQIDFSDVVGTIIASRRFHPEEYLALEPEDIRALEPDAPVSFSMEILDPGKRALTYEFDFL